MKLGAFFEEAFDLMKIHAHQDLLRQWDFFGFLLFEPPANRLFGQDSASKASSQAPEGTREFLNLRQGFSYQALRRGDRLVG